MSDIDIGDVHYPVSILANFAGISIEHAELFYRLATELSDRQARVTKNKKEVSRLESMPRCCGREWMNNAGSMYCHHSIGDDCPVHGTAEPGASRGLRSYIGRDDANQAEARAAMRTWDQWVTAKQELRTAENDLSRLVNELHQAGATQKRFHWNGAGR